MDVDMKNKDDGDDKGIIPPTNGGNGRDYDRDKDRDMRDRDYDRDRDRRDRGDKDRDRDRGSDRRDSGKHSKKLNIDVVYQRKRRSSTSQSRRSLGAREALKRCVRELVLALAREDVRHLLVVAVVLAHVLAHVPGLGADLVAETASQLTHSRARSAGP
ncbi:hypothetical protein CVT25_001890 [Psilocybe cyanescens]|uniref:Uncharacterized protein n=1 Tax=Psilocybe cyanescens TaxID=93625 RepID=A0A409WQX7_PSICY|nr:hypothetical protein CVT25_001890 [Psilocybe cyanescens]